MSGPLRRRRCTGENARARCRQAVAYLETAKLVASDALCCQLLGERSRGQGHRDAVDLLATVRFGEGTAAVKAKRASNLGAALATVLDFKDEAHYGTTLLGPAQVRRLIKAADKLVSATVAVVP